MAFLKLGTVDRSQLTADMTLLYGYGAAGVAAGDVALARRDANNIKLGNEPLVLFTFIARIPFESVWPSG
jgi:hypothetical protein